MIEFTYGSYSLLDEEEAYDYFGAPENWTLPNELITAMDRVRGMAALYCGRYEADCGDDGKVVTPQIYNLTGYDIMQAVSDTAHRIDPTFAQIVKDAAEEGRFFLTHVSDLPENRNFVFNSRQIDDKAALEMVYDGGIISLAFVMREAGRLIALERSHMPLDVPADSCTLQLASTIQRHFLQEALLDAKYFPGDAEPVASEIGIYKRKNLAQISDDWFSTMDEYHKIEKDFVGKSGLTIETAVPGLLVHQQHDAPSSIIAAALYESFSFAMPARKKTMLETIYPIGSNAKPAPLPKLEKLLELVGVKDEAGLKDLFTITGGSLYAAPQTLNPLNSLLSLPASKSGQQMYLQ